MKKQIFGRKFGTEDDMVLLIDGSGVSTGGRKVDAATNIEFSLANTRRIVKVLRDKNIEGYIVFENDTTQSGFTPKTDFLYPATVH